MFKVQYVGDPKPMDSGTKTLQLVKRADASDDNGDDKAYVLSDDEATLSDENGEESMCTLTAKFLATVSQKTGGSCTQTENT